MRRAIAGTLAVVSGVWLTAAPALAAARQNPVAASDQFKQFAMQFQEQAHALWNATTDEQRTAIAARVDKLTPRLLELAEKNPGEPVAIDALTQVLLQEIWLENNTSYAGKVKDSPQRRAIGILLRDHVASDRLGATCRRAQYGFSQECESFLRTVLDKSPHREIQALACLRLAQFLNLRLRRLDLLRERPEMFNRYRGLFGSDYLEKLQRRDPADALREVEALFERAIAQYGDIQVSSGGTTGETAQAELHEIRHLAVGRQAQEIEGADQDGLQFKLSDYRGKVVLLYFWSEY